MWASVGCRKRENKVPIDDESSGLVGAGRAGTVMRGQLPMPPLPTASTACIHLE